MEFRPPRGEQAVPAWGCLSSLLFVPSVSCNNSAALSPLHDLKPSVLCFGCDLPVRGFRSAHTSRTSLREFKVVPGRSCTIPVADVGKMLQKFKPKSATLQFWLCKRGDEQQKKPQLLLTSSCWCSMKISRLAKPVLVPNLWNIKDFSPSGRF